MTLSPNTSLAEMEPSVDDLQRRVRSHSDGAKEVVAYLSTLAPAARDELIQGQAHGTKATLLHVAAAEGEKLLASQLLHWGADPRALDRDDETALHWAASRNAHEVIRTLINGGCDLEAKDRYAETPLMKSVSASAAESMLNLLEAGADREAANDKGVKPIDLIGYQPGLHQMFNAWSARDVIRSVSRRHQP